MSHLSQRQVLAFACHAQRAIWRLSLQASIRAASTGRFGKQERVVTPDNSEHSGVIPGLHRPTVGEFPDARVKLERMAKATSTAPHHRALQKIAEFAPMAGVESVVQKYRDRQVRIRARNDYQQQHEIFEESRKFLMHPETWTYGNMMAYQQKILDLMGAYSWRRRLSEDDPSIKHLEKELKVLQAMTPVELASNHRRVFTGEAIKLIAEKSGTTEKYVNQVIMEHDILRGDRRWYKILEQFQRPLPKTFEDRQHMAEYDRPMCETERDLRQRLIDQEGKKAQEKNIKPKRMKSIWFRTPTCGGNRWSTGVPKWYPAKFFMRTERIGRLSGNYKGRGNARDAPWGNLARHGVGVRPGVR